MQLGLRNSLIVVVCSVLLLIPLGSAFSFFISRKRTRVRAAILAVLAAGLMIPPQVVLLPTIHILTLIGLDHTYPGLILSNIGGGYLSFAVFVYVGFMRAIPGEIVEAARMDGASGLRIWWTIIMPLVRPATATVAIFLSLWIWNDFLNPLFILGPLTGPDHHHRTVFISGAVPDELRAAVRHHVPRRRSSRWSATWPCRSSSSPA